MKNIFVGLRNFGALAFYIISTFYLVDIALKSNKEQITSTVKQGRSSQNFGPCNATETVKLQSPDGEKIAILGFVDCGATTNWRSGITVTNLKTSKSYTGLFGLDGKPDELKMTWKNNHTLVLSGFPIDKVLWLNQDEFSGTKIVLQP